VFIVALLAGCSFERSPVVMKGKTAGAPALTMAPEGGMDAEARPDSEARPPDLGNDDAAVDMPHQSQTGSANGATHDMPQAGGPTPSDDDAGTPPKPDQVQCENVFCPIASAPVKACCTTPTDVTGRMSREAGLCGMNLSGVDKDAYGGGCWQRDRLGIIDNHCPDRGSEVGCCADDGLCGTNNTDQQLGCHHTPGVEPQPCRDSMLPNTPMCDPTGTYGFRVTVDTTWDGRDSALAALTDDGRGPIQIYILADVKGVDAASGEVTTTGRVCGVSLPPFYSTTLCESYQPAFPARLWESQKLPRLTIPGQYDCTTQGCVLSLGPLTYVFGIHLDNPESPWPTPQQTPHLSCPGLPNEQCFTDDDDDGQPGVQIDLQTTGTAPLRNPARCTNGYKYRAAPLNASIAAIFDGVRRSDRLLVGIRARVGSSIRFDENCQSAKGSAIAQYVNSRAQGCFAEPGSFNFLQDRPAGPMDPCSSDEAQFIDLSMPDYHVLAAGEKPMETSSRHDTTPSDGPVASMVKFGPSGTSITCEQVRDASY
jgi:hypothetical protein